MKRIALLAAAVLATASAARGDELVLRNGRTLEGKVTVAKETVTFERPGIRMEIRRDEVEAIRRTPTVRERYAERLGAVEKDDAEGYHRLGLWCAAEGLAAEGRAAQERAVRLDPEHEGARRALGQVKFEGAWRDRGEVLREQGFVEVAGEWVSPEEAEARHREIAAAKGAAAGTKRELQRDRRRRLNAALRMVASEKATDRKRGERALTMLGEALGEPELIARAPEIRAWYDRFHAEISRARALVEVRAQLVTLKRPIPTFETSLGAFGSPVRIQLPEVSVISVSTTAMLPVEVDVFGD